MTTENTNAAAIAASLTEGEQLHLRLFNRDPHAMSVTPSADSLVKKGLVKWGWDTGHVLTTTGNAVLAALTPPADDSGSATGATGEDWKAAAESANNLYLAEKERYTKLYNEYIDDQNQHEELVSRTLYLLGVDPSDWINNEAGIEAAVNSNLQIGEPHMSKVEDWTDQNHPNEGSITEHMFKLLERAQKAESALAASRQRAAKLEAALKEVNELARNAQGEWGGVDPVYQPMDLHPFSEIEDLTAKALAKAAALKAAEGAE